MAYLTSLKMGKVTNRVFDQHYLWQRMSVLRSQTIQPEERFGLIK